MNPTTKRPELYCAYSAVKWAPNQYPDEYVSIEWFCNERKKPVAPYQQLLKDYQPMDYEAIRRSEEHRSKLSVAAAKQAVAESYVDEFLTAAEVESLRAYLELEIFVCPVGLPLPFADCEGYLMPTDAIGAGGGHCFVDLKTGPRYDLSIPICGYYNRRLSGSFDEIMERVQDWLRESEKSG